MRIFLLLVLSLLLNSECWAQSARDVVLSFIGSQMSEMKSNPQIRFDDGDPRRYAAAWPQISPFHIMSLGGQPSKVAIALDGRISKYLVVSDNGNDVTIFFSDDRVTDASLSFGPQTIVGVEIIFRTGVLRREGRKILLTLDADKMTGRFKNQTFISWREFAERGYKDRLASVYSIRPQAPSNSESQTGKLQCEAQKKTCFASCGNISNWNGSRYVENESWSNCDSQCRSISCF